MTNDPFTQPTGGGNYPKLDELEGSLILLKPSIVETVPGYQGKGTTQRATADCWVFGPDLDPANAEKYNDMYFSQAGIVPACKNALKPDSKFPYVLGVVAMFPSKTSKAKGIDTPEKLKEALAEWLRKGAKGDKPQYAWGLASFNDEQAAAARALVESFRPADPFKATSE